MTKPAHALLSHALRRAGIVEVDGTSRRRAECSGDASLYRAAPGAVMLPRHAGEIAATVEAARPVAAAVPEQTCGVPECGHWT